ASHLRHAPSLEADSRGNLLRLLHTYEREFREALEKILEARNGQDITPSTLHAQQAMRSAFAAGDMNGANKMFEQIQKYADSSPTHQQALRDFLGIVLSMAQPLLLIYRVQLERIMNRLNPSDWPEAKKRIDEARRIQISPEIPI